MTYTRLPYEFDLLYDVKSVEELYSILAGEPHCTDADIWELEELMDAHEIPFPDWHDRHLKPGWPTVVWINVADGSWTTTKPADNEMYMYQRMRKY